MTHVHRTVVSLRWHDSLLQNHINLIYATLTPFQKGKLISIFILISEDIQSTTIAPHDD